MEDKTDNILERRSRLIDPNSKIEGTVSQIVDFATLIQERRVAEEIPLIQSAVVDYLADLKRNSSTEYHNSIDICRACMNLLQEDTVQEFYMLTNAKDKHTMPNKINGNYVMFLLASNLMNRGDEMVEMAVAQQQNENPGLVLENIVKKGIHGKLTEDGADIDISPEQMIRHMHILAEAINTADTGAIDTSNWKQIIDNLLISQAEGLELARKGNYTFRQAINYKRATLDPYIDLLSTIAQLSQEEKGKFRRRYWYVQGQDDTSDILEDMGVQPNPWISALQEQGLLEEFFGFVYTTEDTSVTKFLENLEDQNRRRWRIGMIEDVYRYIGRHPEFNEQTFNRLIEIEQLILETTENEEKKSKLFDELSEIIDK